MFSDWEDFFQANPNMVIRAGLDVIESPFDVNKLVAISINSNSIPLRA
jgi:hypothetical protein